MPNSLDPKFIIPSSRYPTLRLSLFDEFRLFYDIANNVGVELIIIDKEGKIIFANKTAQLGLGYSRHALLQKNITDFFKEKMTPAQWQKKYFQELKKLRRPVIYEVERTNKGGHVRTIEITAVYMKYKPQEYILSVGRDITERLIIERSRRDYDKMMALRHFVSGTAQEIRFPLEAVLTHLQTMIRKYSSLDFEYISYKEFKNLMQFMTNVTNQIRHCRDVADRLLVFDKRNNHLKEPCCFIQKTITDAMSRLEQELRLAGVDVALRFAKNLPCVRLNDIDLEHIFRNIVLNAIQAMSGGGKLFIKTFHSSKDNRVHFEFKDTGVGISKENLAHVIEPFFTTKQTAPGQSVGLGLSVVYSIVKGAKGDLAIESSLRQGTVVKISLPACQKHSRR